MDDANGGGDSSAPLPAGGPIYVDRADAGRQLAASLATYNGVDGAVLALPRGGVPVGYEVARVLGIPLDVYVVRKLGAPDQPELGIGAIAPGGVIVLDTATISALGIAREQIDQVVAAESAELARRIRAFQVDRPEPDVRGKTVILVDDGLATGVTASAAILALRRQEPARIVLAVPVCASATADALRTQVDDLVCLETPQPFAAVGLWYSDFSQTTDEEVVNLLGRWRAEQVAVRSGGSIPDRASRSAASVQRSVRVPTGDVSIGGELTVPDSARGVVLFAHGSGSSRFSSRNRAVARDLNGAGFATLLIDLLTAEEERAEAQTSHLRFNIGLLAQRLTSAIEWLRSDTQTSALSLGLFGASTGAGAALVAAASQPESVVAIVSRGGRPDLAGGFLVRVVAPTLLIVGGADTQVRELNKEAFAQLQGVKEMSIIPGATHLFEEPGALEEVSRLAVQWFSRYLGVGPTGGR